MLLSLSSVGSCSRMVGAPVVELAADLLLPSARPFFLFLPPKKPNCLSTEDMELRTEPEPDAWLAWLLCSSLLLSLSALSLLLLLSLTSFSFCFLALLSPTDSLLGSLQSTSNILPADDS